MQPLKSVRAVTFDVGGTLLEPWPSVGHVYADVAAQFGIPRVGVEELNQRFASAWKERRGFDYTRPAWRNLVNRTFAGLGPESPSLACFDAIYQRFAQAKSWRVFDDVFPALAALKAHGFKLGIVSNWDERLRPLLDEVQLAGSFDAIVISHEAGHAKPSGEIFHLAASRLGTPIGSMLHVGDGIAEDVVGAQASGAQAALLDRGATQAGSAVVRSLNQLAAVLVEASIKKSTD
jgi:putative hydrolase of the HAD superfamily